MSPSALIVKRARRHGIRYPQVAYEEFRRIRNKPSGFDFALVCALLMRETSGGLNVFGHDPTIFVGAGVVSRVKYLAYKRLRDAVRKNQGVGPCQLTSSGLQDEADRIGGCWKPRFNMRVGFKDVADLIREHGLHDGLRRYNGSGAGAERYARSVIESQRIWRKLLSGATADALHDE